MAYSSNNTNLLILSFLLLLSFTITLSIAKFNIKITIDELNQVRSKTTNPAYCMHVLKSDRRTASTNRKGLATISIDIAENKSSKTLDLIKSLAQREPNLELKDKYSICSDKYTSTAGNLKHAKQAPGLDDYTSMQNSASSANDAILDCRDLFEAPPSAPPSLSQANEDMENLINIVFNVAGGLQSQDLSGKIML